MPLSESQRAELLKQLEKRATHKAGVNELTRLLCEVPLGDAAQQQLSDLFPIVSRVHQLLKARHTNLDFWRTGATLFSTCQHLQFPPDQLQKLRQFHADALTFIHEATGGEGAPVPTQGPGTGAGVEGSSGSQASAASAGFPLTEAGLMELLNGPPPQPESHFDDAGPIIDEDSERWRRAQFSGTPVPEGGAGSGASGADGGEGADVRTRQRAVQQQRRDLQRQILEGIQAVYTGVEAVSRGTDAISRELDSLLGVINARAAEAAAASAQAPQPPPRPPASKRALAALPVVEATEEKLREWGAGCACAVCTCELSVGDQVQVLPCRHMYHPDCLAPWLAKDNTCPMCRKELPTDDPHYEARKEREAEMEEERRGAANALRGGEHMYI